MSRRREAIILALILVGAFALRWSLRHAALVRDEAEYAHMGWRVLQGEIPYRDVYSQKTPLVFYVSAAVQAVAGKDPAALRVVQSLWLAGAGLLLWAAARSLLGPAAALWSAAAFAVMTFDQNIEHAFSTEGVMLLWVCLGLWLWHGPRRAKGFPWTSALAGAAGGLAFLTKQTGIALAAYFVGEALLRSWRRRALPREAAPALAALAGFAAGLILASLWFWRQGALRELVDCAWLHNLSYVGSRQAGPAEAIARLGRVLSGVARWDLGLWLLGAGALLRRGWKKERPEGLWLLLAAFAAAAFSAGQAYAHYFLPLVAPLSLGVGDAMPRLLKGRGPALLALALLPWLPPAIRHVQLLAPTSARAALMRGAPPYDRIPELGAFLAERTKPEDRLAVIGSEFELFWRAGRAACTRLVFTYPMVGPYPHAPRLREEFLAQLKACRPPYVVVVRRIGSLTEWPGHLRPFLESVSAVLEPDYREAWAVTESGIVPARGRDLTGSGMIVLKRINRAT